MFKLIFVLLLTSLIVASVFFFFKDATWSYKWKVVKTVLYLLFFGVVAVSILAAIVILF